jgi:NAD+ kinase
MKIAIFGRITRSTRYEILNQFLHYLQAEQIEFLIYDEYAQKLAQVPALAPCWDLLNDRFTEAKQISDCDFIYSIGGDGTILDTVRLIGPLNIPIVGVNVGRLGFLAVINQEEVIALTQELLKGNWLADTRSLVQIKSNPDTIFKDVNFALNEVTIHKSNTNEMITVHTYINGAFLNSYWADGLIVSTPTGSTAYSLACGGPIITPQASTFVITPIAPHSLTVRPFIIEDSATLSFEIESRSGQALVALDNRNELIQDTFVISVEKASFTVTLVKSANRTYFQTLRDRLNWGLDSRN